MQACVTGSARWPRADDVTDSLCAGGTSVVVELATDNRLIASDREAGQILPCAHGTTLGRADGNKQTHQVHNRFARFAATHAARKGNGALLFKANPHVTRCIQSLAGLLFAG